MTKQLIAIAFAAAFGIAHAADVKPAAAPVAAKAETPQGTETVKAPETKAAAAEVKKDEAKPVEKKAKPAKKAVEAKPVPEAAKAEPAKVEAVKAVEPAKK